MDGATPRVRALASDCPYSEILVNPDPDRLTHFRQPTASSAPAGETKDVHR
jgi:hypothetical protein